MCIFKLVSVAVNLNGNLKAEAEMKIDDTIAFSVPVKNGMYYQLVMCTLC